MWETPQFLIFPEMIKLTVFATHPIQYATPWFQGLNQQADVDLTVYYGFIPNPEQQGQGFGVSFKWDVPLLDGYQWQLLATRSDLTKTKRFWPNFIRLGKILTQFKKDGKARQYVHIVIITGWNALMLWQALFFCWFHRIPCIVRGDSNALRQRPYYKRWLHRLLLSRFDAFLSVGQANQQFYIQNKVNPNKIFFCPHCVDNQRFLRQSQRIIHQRLRIRTQMGIPSKSFCFIYAGKMNCKKRIGDLLRALQLLQKASLNIHLLVVGDGRLMLPSVDFVHKHHLPVTFAGFLNQNEIIRAYVISDCLVLPSDYGETWGLVVNEAMVCGLPAIVSERVGCGPDLIEDGVTGMVFPFGDVEALAQKMYAMAFEKNSRAMGLRAKQRILDQYSVEKMIKGTMQAVKMVRYGSSK